MGRFCRLMKCYVKCGLVHLNIYDLVPKGVHENRTKGVENKVDDTLKLVVFRLSTMLGNIS